MIKCILDLYGKDSIAYYQGDKDEIDEQVWDFFHKLVNGYPLNILCSAIAPSIGIEIDIKTILLLQLVGGYSPDIDGMHIRGDINILLTGQGIEELLSEVASVNPKAVYMTGQDASDVNWFDDVNKDGALCVNQIHEMDEDESQIVLMQEAIWRRYVYSL